MFSNFLFYYIFIHLIIFFTNTNSLVLIKQTKKVSTENQESQDYNRNKNVIIDAGEEGDLFEGDIILTSEEESKAKRKGKNLVLNRAELWPNGILHYDYAHGEFDKHQKELIESAISDLQLNTCVRFLRRNRRTKTYIYFRNTPIGCASAVGYRPLANAIHLFLGGSECQTHGTIQHELLHALGFWHEHTRPDRDKFIKVKWENIQRGREYNFFMKSLRETSNFGMPYDYGSVMHYKPTAFSKDRISPTIIPNDINALNVIGQRIRFSNIDIAKLNILYSCNSKYYYKGDYNTLRKMSVIGEFKNKIKQ